MIDVEEIILPKTNKLKLEKLEKQNKILRKTTNYYNVHLIKLIMFLITIAMITLIGISGMKLINKQFVTDNQVYMNRKFADSLFSQIEKEFKLALNFISNHFQEDEIARNKKYYYKPLSELTININNKQINGNEYFAEIQKIRTEFQNIENEIYKFNLNTTIKNIDENNEIVNQIKNDIQNKKLDINLFKHNQSDKNSNQEFYFIDKNENEETIIYLPDYLFNNNKKFNVNTITMFNAKMNETFYINNSTTQNKEGKRIIRLYHFIKELASEPNTNNLNEFKFKNDVFVEVPPTKFVKTLE